jgi:hypothetical protein
MSPKVLIVLVVDDRPTAQAALLRSGVEPAMRRLAQTATGGDRMFPWDRAAWHPLDMQVLVVPASSTTPDAIASPVTDASLAWTTVQATVEDADALAAAVGARVTTLTASPGAPFHPLEHARDVVQLMAGMRPPAGEVEGRLSAIASAHPWQIGVSVIAASDDESPDPPSSYWVGDNTYGPFIAAGLVTPETGPSGGFDAKRSPRLAAWADNGLTPPISGCYNGPETPFFLFPVVCIDFNPRCDGRPIEQLSPGLGTCRIDVTTREPECSKSRGWIDPLDVDGVRRPRVSASGVRTCDALPVDPAFMDACIHDAACEGCGAGWCITELFRMNPQCRAGSMLRPIRWVGGVLPDPGSVHVACREAAGAF